MAPDSSRRREFGGFCANRSCSIGRLRRMISFLDGLGQRTTGPTIPPEGFLPCLQQHSVVVDRRHSLAAERRSGRNLLPTSPCNRSRARKARVRQTLSQPFLYLEPHDCCYDLRGPLMVTIYAVNRSGKPVVVDWSAIVEALSLEAVGPGSAKPSPAPAARDWGS